MRLPHLSLSLLLVAIPAAGDAQPPSQASQGSMIPGRTDCRGSAEEIRSCGEAWYKDCLKDWDSATHMSKKDYARTCRRVVDSRVKALVEQTRRAASEKRKSER
jgi:hypothetical protein